MLKGREERGKWMDYGRKKEREHIQREGEGKT